MGIVNPVGPNHVLAIIDGGYIRPLVYPSINDQISYADDGYGDENRSGDSEGVWQIINELSSNRQQATLLINNKRF